MPDLELDIERILLRWIENREKYKAADISKMIVELIHRRIDIQIEEIKELLR